MAHVSPSTAKLSEDVWTNGHVRRDSVYVKWVAFVDELVAGSRSALVLVGRGGSGKSTAARHAIVQAKSMDVPVRMIRGRRLDHAAPYSSVEDHLSLSLLESLLNDPSRRDLLEARGALMCGLEPGLLVIEDAQWIDPASLMLLAALTSNIVASGTRLLITQRPRSNRSDLAALTEMQADSGIPIVLGSLLEDDVRAAISGLSSVGNDTVTVERIATATAGAPFLLHALTESEVVAGVDARLWLSGGQCPAAVVEAVRMRLGHVSETAHALLVALSYGASMTGDELGDLLEVSDYRVVSNAARELHDEGLLTDDGTDVVPLVAEVTAILQPPVERRHHHLNFAAVLEARGGSIVTRAEHLEAAGAPARELADVYVEAADELMADAPALALEWLDRADNLGLSATDLAGRRVDALLRAGRPLDAIRSAEPLFRSEAPDRSEGLRRAATAFAQARMPGQASKILTELAPELDEYGRQMAAQGALMCATVAGTTIESCGIEVFRDDLPATSDPLLEVGRLINSALAGVLADDLDLAAAAAVDALELEIVVVGLQRLPLDALSVALAAAVYSIDLPLARRLTSRALQAPSMADTQIDNRALRKSLVEVWTGAASVAVDPMARWEELGPSDQLVAAAVAAGLARRSNDVERLRFLHERFMEVLLLPPDLLSLPAFCEVMAGAARLHGLDVVSDARRARDTLLASLGRPAALEVAVCWSDLNLLVASNSVGEAEALRERLSGFSDLPADRLVSMVGVMTTWCEVLLGAKDPEATVAAGQELHRLGFGWEAGRLVGSAAVRTDDASVTRELLAAARDLSTSHFRAETGTPLSSLLSSRELEVAHLLAGGHTYKVIGARLFISPKTVEHHAASIRQRLGSTSRAEMLARLRAELVR